MPTILIVDDDEHVRQFVRTVLEDGGYCVLSAGDGEEGMELFRQERPDLIITDIAMPRKGGIETIIEIRRETPGAAIIAISGGSGDNADVLRVARLLGARDVLPKPFGARALLSSVRRCLEGMP